MSESLLLPLGNLKEFKKSLDNPENVFAVLQSDQIAENGVVKESLKGLTTLFHPRFVLADVPLNLLEGIHQLLVNVFHLEEVSLILQEPSSGVDFQLFHVDDGEEGIQKLDHSFLSPDSGTDILSVLMANSDLS